MRRRLRPLEDQSLEALPGACQGCMFWETAKPLEVRCGAACDLDGARRWHRWVASEWGPSGLVAMEGEHILGFIKYAPPEYFRQVGNLHGSLDERRSVLIACMHIQDEARNRGLGTLLLRAALKDLVSRGEKTVYAYATTQQTDISAEPMIGLDFLQRNGFTIVTPHPQYPLLRLELKTLVSLTENLESVLQALRIPLRRNMRMPSPSIESRGEGR